MILEDGKHNHHQMALMAAAESGLGRTGGAGRRGKGDKEGTEEGAMLAGNLSGMTEVVEGEEAIR